MTATTTVPAHIIARAERNAAIVADQTTEAHQAIARVWARELVAEHGIREGRKRLRIGLKEHFDPQTARALAAYAVAQVK